MAGASILLLEDDPGIRDLLTEVFTGEGYRVEACASLDDVCRARGVGEVAVAVMGAWGESHAVLSASERRQIRDVARTVPTIMVTGRQWAAATPPADLGLLGLVRKPFDVDELVGLIRGSVEGLLQERAEPRIEDGR